MLVAAWIVAGDRRQHVRAVFGATRQHPPPVRLEANDHGARYPAVGRLQSDAAECGPAAGSTAGVAVANGTMPATTAAADPPDDPPARASDPGFWPRNGCSRSTNPLRTRPCSPCRSSPHGRSRDVRRRSRRRDALKLSSIREPQVILVICAKISLCTNESAQRRCGATRKRGVGIRRHKRGRIGMVIRAFSRALARAASGARAPVRLPRFHLCDARACCAMRNSCRAYSMTFGTR